MKELERIARSMCSDEENAHGYWQVKAKELSASIRALDAAGYVPVPKTITQEMLIAARPAFSQVDACIALAHDHGLTITGEDPPFMTAYKAAIVARAKLIEE